MSEQNNYKSTFTLEDFYAMIRIADAHWKDKPAGSERRRMWNFVMRYIPQQKYRPLKRECPITKRDEAGRTVGSQGKRLYILIHKKPSLKTYSFMKRLIKRVAR